MTSLKYLFGLHLYGIAERWVICPKSDQQMDLKHFHSGAGAGAGAGAEAELT